MGGPLAAHTRNVQRNLIERTPFPRLVQMVRTGPPRLSLFAIPGMDARVNLVEFFVHHEDVRRAQPGWEPRNIDHGLAELLWQRLGRAKLMLRKAPVGVEFARDDEPGRGRAGRPEGPDHGQGAGADGDRHRHARRADHVGPRPARPPGCG